jgi:hypothetical protein
MREAGGGSSVVPLRSPMVLLHVLFPHDMFNVSKDPITAVMDCMGNMIGVLLLYGKTSEIFIQDQNIHVWTIPYIYFVLRWPPDSITFSCRQASSSENNAVNVSSNDNYNPTEAL